MRMIEKLGVPAALRVSAGTVRGVGSERVSNFPPLTRRATFGKGE
jgi:hypothetical protein